MKETKKISHSHASHSNDYFEISSLHVLLIVLVAVLVVLNQVLISGLASQSPSTLTKSSSTKKFASTGDPVQDSINQVIPTGVPDVYGPELGVSFDEPVPGLNVLSKLERQYTLSSLTPEEKQKYIEATLPISCEFCCGAPSVISSTGQEACGCAHAAAIRGLGLYLVKTHPEFSAQDILAETTKWKALFFPKQMVQKGAALLQNNMEITPQALNDRQLLSKISAGNTADIGNLPSMVGGC